MNSFKTALTLLPIFIIFPFILFFMAFESGSAAFKDSVNNYAEFYYLPFMIMGLTCASLVTKFIMKHQSIKAQKANILLILKILVIIYGVFLILIATSRFISYQSEGIDVMFFKEELWRLSAFQLPEYAWAQHFSPILLFLVPFFWLIKSGTFLMFMQATAVISGGIPLYLVIKEKLKSELLGLALIFSYLSFGGLQFGYAYGFHEIMFLPPLFFWMYYFLIKKRIVLYFLFVLLCLFVKEEVSFIMIFWGFYLLYTKNYRYALGTILLGIAWYMLCFQFIFPYFNKGGEYGYWGQFPNAGHGFFGLIAYIFLHPLEFLAILFTPNYKIFTIFHSFGNFSFLSFLYPPSLLMIIPSLMQKLLSSDIAAKNGFHYSAAITAVMLVSVIESLYFVQKKKLFAKFITNRNAFFGILIFYVAFCANMLFGYHQLSPLLLTKEKGLTDQEITFLNQTLQSIPPHATIAAQYHIRSHIDKPYWQTFDAGNDADYKIIQINLPLVLGERETLEKHIVDIVNQGKYEVVVNAYGTLLLKKK